MLIQNTTKEIIKKLQDDGISKEMQALETSSWCVIEQQTDKITGIAGIGGIFNITSIFIDKDHRGKGLGKSLQTTLVNEAKNRRYSFLAVFIDPTNTSSIKLHDQLGYKSIFRIRYSKEITQEIKILVFNTRGKLIEKLLHIFNTLVGITFLAIILKITTPIFPQLISYKSKAMPKPSIKWIIANFEKIHCKTN